MYFAEYIYVCVGVIEYIERIFKVKKLTADLKKLFTKYVRDK